MNINKKWLAITTITFIVLYLVLKVEDAWSFWVALVVGWIFSRSRKKENLSVKTENNEKNEENKIAHKTKESEAERVRKIAEKIKKDAMDSGVPKLICELYHDNIHYYSGWIKHSPRGIPEMITEAIKKDKELLIKMNGIEYKFTYEEHASYMSGDNDYYGDLELFFNGEKVLHVNEVVSHGEYGSNHYPISVDAFIQGDWIEDFKELDNQIKKDREERKKREFENPEEIRKLKKDFGIE